MTTKTFDSTVSQILQDNSSVEYIDAQENPITTIQNSDLIFGQKHNDIDCALCPTAKRACDRAWVTAKQIENWSGMSKMTLWRWLERIEKARRIQSVSDMIQIKIDDENGRGHETTLYNLNVLNQLAMACIDNEKLNEVSCQFSDILSEVETTGSYGVTQTQPQPVMLPNFCNPAEAARAWADLYEKNQAIELRALTAESERDEAIRTKARIGSSREATAMATASAKSRECKRLTAENEELKDAVGRGTNWHTVNMMTAEWKREFGHEPSCHKLKKFSADLPKDMQPIKDVEVKVVLSNGSEKINKLFRYHREAWAKYREYEENSRVRGKNVPDTKILGLRVTDTEIEVF